MKIVTFISILLFFNICSFAQDKTKTSIGISAGFTKNRLKFTTDSYNYKYLLDQNFENSRKPTVGLNVEFNFSDDHYSWSTDHYSWSIFGEVNYHSFEYYSNYVDFNNHSHKVIIDVSYISFTPMLRYKIPCPVIRPYLSVGYGFGRSFNVRQVHIIDYYNARNPEDTRQESDPIFSDFRKVEDGPMMAVGLLYNDISLEFRYEQTTGISKLLAVNSYSHRFYFLFGYKFVKW